jgi:nitrate/TMAO reductase-like tetraheme cytochrome c subunit
MFRHLEKYSHEFAAAIWEVVKLPFWVLGQGLKRLYALGGRRLIFLALAVVVVTIVFMVLSIKATSQPGFCKSCHVMVPYFKAWETSQHNFVNCTQCHVPPGIKGTLHHKFQALSMVVNYMTGLYKRSKPWAEVEDAACLNCHDKRLLKSTENFKGVLFDHRPHLTQPRRDRQLRCTSCHAQIVQGEHITVTETTCFLCHFKPDSTGHITDLARCTHCHVPPTGPAAADTAYDHASVLARGVDCNNCHRTAVSGDGFVPVERCNSCHAQADHIQRYGDRDFVHQMHVTEHKVECTNCHVAITHGKKVVPMDGPKEQCSACHGVPDRAMELVWDGTLPGVRTTPSPMGTVGMVCTSCHVEPIHNNGKGFSKPTCTPCHTPEYNQLWPKWKGPLEQALRDLEARVAKMPEPDRSDLQRALDIYRRGNPLHNTELVKALEERISGQVVSTVSAVGGCASCHPAALNTSPLYLGKRINHRRHFEVTGSCETCHSGAPENHGRIILTMDQCNQCHHRDVAKAKVPPCKTCHATQLNINAGLTTLTPDAQPSAMFEAGIQCTDCHLTETRQVTRLVAPQCIGCHDQSYGDTLRTWQARGDSLAARAKQLLSVLKPGTDQYNQVDQFSTVLREEGSRSAHNPYLFARWMERREATP